MPQEPAPRTELAGEVCLIRPLLPADVEPLLELRRANRDFLAPFEPRRADPDDGFTERSIRALIARDLRAWERDQGYGFGVFLPTGEIVGRVALSNVVRGGWQNATLGYYVGEAHNGQGIATEAVRLAVRFAFGDARLHRVQAAVMPTNVASRRVLEKAGFKREGFSPYYLQIAGRWEDHDVFALTAENA